MELSSERAEKVVELLVPEKNVLISVKFMGTSNRCPYLNKNDYCIVTRIGAGCRLEFCTNERHTICGDYQNAEKWASKQ